MTMQQHKDVQDAITRLGLDPRTSIMAKALLDCRPQVEPDESYVMAIGPAYRSSTLKDAMTTGLFGGTLAGLGYEDWVLYSNPTLLAKYTPAEVQYITSHEGAHKLMGHPFIYVQWQKEGRVGALPLDHRLAQIAMDMIVNNFVDTENAFWLEKTGSKSPDAIGPYGKRPVDAHVWDQVTWDMDPVAVYAMLYQTCPPQQGGGSGQGKGKSQGGSSAQLQKGEPSNMDGDGFGDDLERAADGTDVDEGTDPDVGNGSNVLSAEQARERANAARGEMLREIARGLKAGTIGGNAARRLLETEQPSYSLDDLLERTLPAMLEGPGREDMRRPQRRMLHQIPPALASGQRICLQPTTVSYQVGDVVVIVDVSGSMMQKDLARAFGTVADVLSRYKPRRVLMLAADVGDTGAGFIELEGPDALSEITVNGGGGTDMALALDQVTRKIEEEYGDAPSLVIIATDGDTPWPRDEVPFPTVAILTRTNQAPPAETGIKVIRWE